MNNRYKKSVELWEKRKKILVPGCQVFTKSPFLYPLGAFPIYLASGKGAHVTDVDGNEYVDFQCCLGANILGYLYEPVVAAIKKQLERGIFLSLPSPLMIEVGEKIQKLFPAAERVRLVKSGSDATTAAIKIARAFTKKSKVGICGFHTSHDWCFGKMPFNRGILPKYYEDTLMFTYNDIESVEKLFHSNDIAAIILEPARFEIPKNNFLQKLRTLTKQHNSLLIFDEVATGFRLSIGGGQTFFDVTPDLCCVGKALGNGMPFAATGGRADIFEATQDVHATTSHHEEIVSIAAALATIEIVENNPVVEHIWKLGKLFQDGYNALAQKYNIATSCIGYPPRLMLKFDDQNKFSTQQLKGYFYQETAKRGFLFGNTVFTTYSHTTSDIEQALASCEETFSALSKQTPDTIVFDGDLPLTGWKDLVTLKNF